MHGIEAAILLIVWIVKAISDATAKSRSKNQQIYTNPTTRPNPMRPSAPQAPRPTTLSQPPQTLQSNPQAAYKPAQLAGPPVAGLTPTQRMPASAAPPKTALASTSMADLARQRQISDKEYAKNIVGQTTEFLQQPANNIGRFRQSTTENRLSSDAARQLVNGVIWAQILSPAKCKKNANSVQ